MNAKPSTIEKQKGFTTKQRQWFLERDQHRCCFSVLEGDSWVRCQNIEFLQVHHIIPRGWASLYHAGWDINVPGNGITLCAAHHVGYGVSEDQKDYVIHWDTEIARRAYIDGNPYAYAIMDDQRTELILNREPYWNTMWDERFKEVAILHSAKYHAPYPTINLSRTKTPVTKPKTRKRIKPLRARIKSVRRNNKDTQPVMAST